MVDKNCLVRFVTQTRVSFSSSWYGRWGVLLTPQMYALLYKWKFTNGNLCPAFWKKGGGQKALPVSDVFRLPSVQNNFHAKVAYFGVAYSDPLHVHKNKNKIKQKHY